MKSWVYEIKQLNSEDSIYIGSTSGKYFCMRKGDHMKPYTMKRKKNRHLYDYIVEHGGWDKFEFVILYEDCEIEKEKLLTLEKEFIANKNPKCNKINPISTKEEYLARKRNDQKKWRQNHPEYSEKRKTMPSTIKFNEKRCSTKIECLCGGKYTLQNKTNHFSTKLHKEYEKTNPSLEENSEISSPK